MKFKITKAIGYLSENFKKHFSYDFKLPKSFKPKFRKLEKAMLDKEILATFQPQEITLGDLMFAIRNNLLPKDDWYIAYIRDKEGTLWAVGAHWDAYYGYWDVDAYSVEDPYEWREGYQVVSHSFGSLELGLDGKILELDGVRYKIIKQ